MKKLKQEEYMIFIADKYYNDFFEQGFATAGCNGPHNHIDTPIRNTSHFLIIYSYLYKITKNNKYRIIAKKFNDYICNESSKTSNNAVQCMITNKFDRLNGLIGQAWAIEGLLYYYGVFKEEGSLNTAKKIFNAQEYNYNEHLWHCIDIDGHDLGIDRTYNHNVWFAACGCEILKYEQNEKINDIITDFLVNGTKRDFRIYKNGLIKHYVNFNNHIKVISFNKMLKTVIKRLLYPLRKYNLRVLDHKYIEKAYHIFDLYGFCIIENMFPNFDFFKSTNYLKAKQYAFNLDILNKEMNVFEYINRKREFNIYGYSYNSLCFEYPYVMYCFSKDNDNINDYLYNLQYKLMYDNISSEFKINNPDIYTFNAKTYEIIRYLDMVKDYEE